MFETLNAVRWLAGIILVKSSAQISFVKNINGCFSVDIDYFYSLIAVDRIYQLRFVAFKRHKKQKIIFAQTLGSYARDVRWDVHVINCMSKHLI